MLQATHWEGLPFCLGMLLKKEEGIKAVPGTGESLPGEEFHWYRCWAVTAGMWSRWGDENAKYHLA